MGAMERSCRLLLLLPLLVSSTTTLGAGQSFSVGASLSTNETWLSENGIFTLGFFPMPAGSSSLYLGVWYSGVQMVPVWLMHRDSALKPGATMALTNAGNLELRNANGSQVWASQTSSRGVVGGRFLENGNIVLRNSSGDDVWDSFDFPTDTFLPGLVVQVGHKFVSWRSNIDPSPGLYSFEMTPSGQLNFKWNNTKIYYDSGRWGGAYFTNPPQLGRTTPPEIFHFDNSTGSPRFWYTTSGRSVANDISLKRMRLNPDGVARQHCWVIGSNSWQTFITAPTEPCDSFRVCGQNSLCASSNYIPGCSCLTDFQPVSPSEWSAQNYWLHGCARIPDLPCTNSTDTSFLALADATIDATRADVQVRFNDSADSCRDQCIQSCACSGYVFAETNSTAGPVTNCTLHSSSTVIFNARSATESTNPVSFLLRYQTGPSPGGGGGSRGLTGAKLVVTVAVVAVVGVVLGIGLVWWVWWVWTRRGGHEQGAKDLGVVGVMRFSYKELVDATGNFGRQLGSGGFGAVYKGTLGDTSEVAVKALARLRQGEQEFRTEVAVIGTVQHINLVRLRGFCAEGDHRALVYEFIPNGSLERYLFTPADQKAEGTPALLPWKTRMTIALGAARGIAYLHHECRSSIIHCDIKPENILLEADFTPKVSDFGLAKLLGKDVSRVITNIRGTRGYLAPEWLTNCTLTSKVDVYSFGMTLLELIGGRRTVDLSLPSEKWFFAVWAYKEIARGEPMQAVVDSRLRKEDVDEAELRRALQVGLWCAQDDPEKRPSMRDVVKMLEGTLAVPDAPAPPSYAQTSDEGFNSGHAALFLPSDVDPDASDLNKISFDYTQSFSAR